VLVAEDNATNQMFVMALLKQFGCQVQVAVNGLETLERFQAESYDLILMDCHMPEMDGYGATREIRRLEAETRIGAGRIPIVALTASVMQEDHDRCMTSGMDGFLTKPLRKTDLHTILERWGHRQTTPPTV
jgi:CheY-like chemotaxis protein